MARANLIVTRLVLGEDMRILHKRRQFVRVGARNEVVLMLNRSRTIARVFDSAKGVHLFYADQGLQFDAEEIVRRIEAFGGLTLSLTEDMVGKIEGSPRRRTRRKKAAA